MIERRVLVEMMGDGGDGCVEERGWGGDDEMSSHRREGLCSCCVAMDWNRDSSVPLIATLRLSSDQRRHQKPLTRVIYGSDEL